MSRRDAYTLGVIAMLGLIAGFWFMVISPKRAEVTKLDKEVQESQSAVELARQEARQFSQARLDFPTDYATVARLGKAVPVDPDIPSLIVQVDRAASRAGVSFRRLELKSGGDSGSGAAPPPSAPTPSGDASGSGATGASGATPSSGTTGAEGASSGATGASGAAAVPVDANAAAAASAPLGVDVGPAGLSMSRFDLVFQGSFFRIADFIHNVRSLVQRRNKQLLVSGRLVTIDGVSFDEGDSGFPQVKATMAATSYLVPQSQGLFAGATSQGPATGTASTPEPPSSSSGASAPPAAVVAPR